MLFLLFLESGPSDSRREQIERAFAKGPGGTGLSRIPPDRQDLVRLRLVRPGMTTDEVSVSWGPPHLRTRGPGSEETWTYPAEGNGRFRVRFDTGVVTSVNWEGGDAPLIPDPYPRLLPRTRRPYLPW